ncbi:hypothetical protein HDU87_000756 [Geranomyces variabilis]|uniref:Uncharacterized protein n=1 Tax=Geranomyces variabilis TaxID=109894 RepID=A0AAD5TQG2_9FUNG|nr:hypothetical protein HDU87_000756 [Geranomyces variabilis]
MTARKKAALAGGSGGLFAGLSDYDEAEDGEFAPPEDASSSDGDLSREDNDLDDHDDDDDVDDDDDNDDKDDSFNDDTDNPADTNPPSADPLKPSGHFLIPSNPPSIRRPQISYPLYSSEFTAIADSRAALHASILARATAARTAALAARQALADTKRRRDEQKRSYDALHEQGSAKRERLAAVLNALGDLLCGYANATQVQVRGGVPAGRTVQTVQRLRPEQVGVFLETFAACARVGQNRLPHLV